MINQAVVDSKSNKLFVHKIMPTSNFASFGDWLRAKIKENDISNAELARRVGVSPTYIGNLLRDFSPNSKTGNIRASELVVEAIANALGADIDEARTAAGYAMKNRVLPSELALMDFDGFDEEDLQDIAEYVAFKRAQKNKGKNNME